MSEPMTNVEIEDVLSSIRKLVSDDGPQKRAAKTGTLMLTPALRVAGTEPSGDTEVARQDTAEVVDAADAADADRLEDRIADLEAKIGRSEEEFEPDGSEDQQEHIPASILTTRPLTVPLESREPEPFESVPAEPEAQAEAAVEASDSQTEAVEPASSGQAEEIPEDYVPDLLLADEPEDDDVTAAELEPESDPFRQPAPQAFHAPEAEAPKRPTTTGGAVGAVEETALVDEDSLREIVSTLVREELRGELGERITRNVRRLIRREIHRALALQELTDDEE